MTVVRKKTVRVSGCYNCPMSAIIELVVWWTPGTASVTVNSVRSLFAAGQTTATVRVGTPVLCVCIHGRRASVATCSRSDWVKQFLMLSRWITRIGQYSTQSRQGEECSVELAVESTSQTLHHPSSATPSCSDLRNAPPPDAAPYSLL